MCENGKETQFQWTKVKNQYYAVIIGKYSHYLHILLYQKLVIEIIMINNGIVVTCSKPRNAWKWMFCWLDIASNSSATLRRYASSIRPTDQFATIVDRINCLHWLLIYFGNSFSYIAAARFASGLTAGGIQTTIVLYVSEIANNE